MYIHTYIPTYIHPSVHPSIHTYIHVRTHVRNYMHTCIHAYMHTYIHTCTYVRTYIHTYIDRGPCQPMEWFGEKAWVSPSRGQQSSIGNYCKFNSGIQYCKPTRMLVRGGPHPRYQWKQRVWAGWLGTPRLGYFMLQNKVISICWTLSLNV